jgi:hypothetical protein
MADTKSDLPVNLQDIRDSGIAYGDKVEFRVRGAQPFSRLIKHKGYFLGYTWRSVDLNQYRRWWDRLAKKPVKCEIAGQNFDPFELVEHLGNTQGLRIMVIQGIKVQVFGEEYEIPWNNVSFLRRRD